MEQVIWLSLVTASVAFTISETALFAGAREWLHGKSVWLGELAGCGYCVGHWIAFALVAIYRPRLFAAWWLLDYFLTALIIAWLSAFQWAALCWLMEKSNK